MESSFLHLLVNEMIFVKIIDNSNGESAKKGKKTALFQL